MNDFSSSTTKSPTTTSHSDDPRSSAERNRKEKLIGVLTDILKVYKRLSYKRLCFLNGCSNTEVADYFLSYSNVGKYNFFQNHPQYFSMEVGGHISLCNNVQNMNGSHALSSDRFQGDGVTIQSQSTVPSNEDVMNNGQRSNTYLLPSPSSYIAETLYSSPSTSYSEITGKNVLKNCPLSSSDSTPNLRKPSGSKKLPIKKATAIETMKYCLNIYKRVHFLKLCDTVKTFFEYYSDYRKFRFFVEHPQHFYVEDDNFITSPNTRSLGQNIFHDQIRNFVVENVFKVSKRQKITKNNQIIEALKSMLKEGDGMYFKNLCTANKTITDYFQSFTNDRMFHFFKHRPTHFVITCSGHVSLREKVINKFSALSCNDSLVSKRKAKSIPLITEDPTSHVCNSNGRNSTLCIQTDFTPSVESSRCSNASLSDQTAPVASPSYVDNTFSQIHVEYVIDIIKTHLNLNTSIHYLELCTYLEKYNDTVRVFFESRSSVEKFRFFEKYPCHFHITADKYVCLPKYASDDLNIMPITKSTSVLLLPVLEEEIIGILIGALKVSRRFHYEKLCKYNDKVAKFFLSYSSSEKYKFYKRFPKYFYLVSDGYVLLSTNVDYHSSLKDVGVSTTTTKNPIACAKIINSENSKIKDENYSSIGPLQERSFYVSDPEIDASSDHLILDVNDVENYINSKIFNEKSLYPNRSRSTGNNNYISSAYNVETFIPCEDSGSLYRNDCTDSQIENTILKDASSSERETTFRDEKHHNHSFDTCSAEKGHAVDNKENVADKPNHWSDQQQICEILDGKLSGSKTSADQPIYKSEINCDVIRSQTAELDSTYVVQEVMETMIDQLKIGKCMHYLKLYEASEKYNGLVGNFFHCFSDAHKLRFLTLHPQYFLVNENNFVTLSGDMNNSTSTSATCEINVNYSSVHANTHRQSENIINLEDALDSGGCITSNETCLYNSEENSVGKGNCKDLLTSDSSHNQDTVDDNHQRLSNRQRLHELLEELSSIAKFFNPELEMQCIKLFKHVIQKNSPAATDIDFLREHVSQYPDIIRIYLAHYIERDLLLFFYLHLDHFFINPSGRISLQFAPTRASYDYELEGKAVYFFTLIVNITSNNTVCFNILENCLNLASEEVQLYLRSAYPSNLKMFFSNHSDHFNVDVFGNISLKL